MNQAILDYNSLEYTARQLNSRCPHGATLSCTPAQSSASWYGQGSQVDMVTSHSLGLLSAIHEGFVQMHSGRVVYLPSIRTAGLLHRTRRRWAFCLDVKQRCPDVSLQRDLCSNQTQVQPRQSASPWPQRLGIAAMVHMAYMRCIRAEQWHPGTRRLSAADQKLKL